MDGRSPRDPRSSPARAGPCGTERTSSEASLTAFTSLPFAEPGCTDSPRIVTRIDAAEKVSISSSPRSEPSSVYATSAPNASRSKSSAPRPTSSSTVNATRIGARWRSPVAREVGDRGHDLRDPGLVVGAEERRPVARDDVVADARGERGQHRRDRAPAAGRRGARSARRPRPRGRSARRPRRSRRASCRRAR